MGNITVTEFINEIAEENAKIIKERIQRFLPEFDGNSLSPEWIRLVVNSSNKHAEATIVIMEMIEFLGYKFDRTTK